MFRSLNEQALGEGFVVGKVLFSTYHQSKGLERRIVILFCFNVSYYLFYAKDLNPLVCPEPLHVGASRASEELHLVGEDQPGDHLPFLDMDRLKALVKMKHVRIVAKTPSEPSNNKKSSLDHESFTVSSMCVAISVYFIHIVFLAVRVSRQATDLTRYLAEDFMRTARTLLRESPVRGAYTSISLESSAGGLVEPPSDDDDIEISTLADLEKPLPTSTREDVCDLNGLALPAVIEAFLRKASGGKFQRASSSPTALPSFDACPLAPSSLPRVEGCADVSTDTPATNVTDALLPAAFRTALSGPARTTTSGLCTMLDILELSIDDDDDAPKKRKRRRDMDAVSEISCSLKEVQDLVRRADSDASLSWAPFETSPVRIPCLSTILRLSSLYQAWLGGYISKHRQLHAFDWITETAARACIEVARCSIPGIESATFEVHLKCQDYKWCGTDHGLVAAVATESSSDSVAHVPRPAASATTVISDVESAQAIEIEGIADLGASCASALKYPPS